MASRNSSHSCTITKSVLLALKQSLFSFASTDERLRSKAVWKMRSGAGLSFLRGEGES